MRAPLLPSGLIALALAPSAHAQVARPDFHVWIWTRPSEIPGNTMCDTPDLKRMTNVDCYDWDEQSWQWDGTEWTYTGNGSGSLTGAQAADEAAHDVMARLYEHATGHPLHIEPDKIALSLVSFGADGPECDSAAYTGTQGKLYNSPLRFYREEDRINSVHEFLGQDPPLLPEVVASNNSNWRSACTYCHPQVASVGYTERALKAQGKVKGKDYDVGVFPFSALGKAIAARHTDGFTKIIRGLPRGEILGAHIMGDQATELIAEMNLARRLEATTEELIVTMHAHPTMHESIHEAALASEGRVINA